MTSGGRPMPGCGGGFLVAIATVGIVALRTVVSCATTQRVAQPSLVSCAQQHGDAAFFGALAFAVVLLFIGTQLVLRLRRRHASPTSAPDVSVVEFAELWADDHEVFERLVALDMRTQTAEVEAEGAAIRRYAVLARQLGLTLPKDEEPREEETTPADVRGTRALAAAILAIAGLWIAWDPLSCAISRASLGRCVEDPTGIDTLIAGIGALVAAAVVAFTSPPIWMRPVPDTTTPPWIWIAEQWQRLVALGREPTGDARRARGARIAEAVSEYVQLARPVMDPQEWVRTGRDVSLAQINPLDVAATFGDRMAEHAERGAYRIRSERLLPYPRRVIRAALYVMLVATRNEKRSASVGPVLMDLAEYVSEEELAPYKEALAAADNWHQRMFSSAQRHLGPKELADELLHRPEDERYDPKRLEPLEDLVNRRQAEEIAELERRYPDLAGVGSAFKLWFMTSVERVLHAVESIEERERITGVDALFGVPRAVAQKTLVGVYTSRELVAEIEAVRARNAVGDERERLALYRNVIERLEQAWSDEMRAVLSGDRAAFTNAEATFRAAVALLRRMEDTSVNTELRQMDLNVRIGDTKS